MITIDTAAWRYATRLHYVSGGCGAADGDTAVNYAGLGPPMPTAMPDTAAVRLLRYAVMTDLNFAGHAVVTMGIAKRHRRNGSIVLVLSVHPETLDVEHAVALQHGAQKVLPLHQIPGVCIDVAQTKVRALFGSVPAGFGA